MNIINNSYKRRGIYSRIKSDDEYIGRWYEGPLLIKYDSSGEIEWINDISDDSDDTINSIEQTDDGGYLISGNFTETSISYEGYLPNFYGKIDGAIIKYNDKGEIEWGKIIGGTDDDYISSVDITKDGKIIAGGNYTSEIIENDGYTLSNSQGAFYSAGMI